MSLAFRRCLATPLTQFFNTMEKTGVNVTDMMVAAIIPPTTAVPMVCSLATPAPEATTKGMKPAMEDTAVLRPSKQIPGWVYDPARDTEYNPSDPPSWGKPTCTAWWEDAGQACASS